MSVRNNGMPGQNKNVGIIMERVKKMIHPPRAKKINASIEKSIYRLHGSDYEDDHDWFYVGNEPDALNALENIFHEIFKKKKYGDWRTMYDNWCIEQFIVREGIIYESWSDELAANYEDTENFAWKIIKILKRNEHE